MVGGWGGAAAACSACMHACMHARARAPRVCACLCAMHACMRARLYPPWLRFSHGHRRRPPHISGAAQGAAGPGPSNLGGEATTSGGLACLAYHGARGQKGEWMQWRRRIFSLVTGAGAPAPNLALSNWQNLSGMPVPSGKGLQVAHGRARTSYSSAGTAVVQAPLCIVDTAFTKCLHGLGVGCDQASSLWHQLRRRGVLLAESCREVAPLVDLQVCPGTVNHPIPRLLMLEPAVPRCVRVYICVEACGAGGLTHQTARGLQTCLLLHHHKEKKRLS